MYVRVQYTYTRTCLDEPRQTRRVPFRVTPSRNRGYAGWRRVDRYSYYGRRSRCLNARHSTVRLPVSTSGVRNPLHRRSIRAKKKRGSALRLRRCWKIGNNESLDGRGQFLQKNAEQAKRRETGGRGREEEEEGQMESARWSSHRSESRLRVFLR